MKKMRENRVEEVTVVDFFLLPLNVCLTKI